jgi:integral membrane sensor domain MASE1
LPAIFAVAFAAGLPADVDAAADSPDAAIAAGNTLEAVVGGWLVNIWSQGSRTFDTPTGTTIFALVGLGPASMIGAAAGVGSLYLAGDVDAANVAAPAVTWWLRDAAGMLVIAPVLVLWATTEVRTLNLTRSGAGIALVAATLVGPRFSPLVEASASRSALGFLAVVPLLWAALRCGQRDTATAALILSGFAVWGALAGGGPFAGTALDQSFFPLIMFMIGVSAPSIALSADVALRRRLEGKLRQQEQILRAMFGQAGVGVVQMDTTGRFNLVNNRFCEIVRRPAPQLLQMRIHDLTDPRTCPPADLTAPSRAPGLRRRDAQRTPDGSRL